MPVPTPQELQAALDSLGPGERKETIWKRHGITRAAIWSKKTDGSWQHPELVAILEAHSDATRPAPTSLVRLRGATKALLEKIAAETGRPLPDVAEAMVEVGAQHLDAVKAALRKASATPSKKKRS